ncbi:MAG TPA: methyltransferase domain-containing protein [Candidatus Angelobacter sp.]|nr:methyltransferase domain-containing protein [Candidatus Angelobacter sp.]
MQDSVFTPASPDGILPGTPKGLYSGVTITAKTESNRFQSDAGKYAAYLGTPEGRLRADLSFANLEDFLQPTREPLRALDLGCGTGATAVRLARLGFQVTALDSSPAMVDFAQRAAREAEVAERITLQLGDAARLADMFTTGAFDVILCHNLLEYVDDPTAVLGGATRVMRNSSAILSVLVRNKAGEVLKAAIQAGDLAQTEDNLSSEWGQESLYGGKVRLFTANGLEAILKAASLTIAAMWGVRVLVDYLPARISRDAEYERILELERKLGRLPEFAAVARYTHCVARRSRP